MPLKVRLMFLMSSVVVVAVAVIAMVFVTYNKQHVQSEFDIRIQSAIEMAAKNLELAVMIKQIDDIERMQKSLLHTPDLVSVSIYDENQVLLSKQENNSSLSLKTKIVRHNIIVDEIQIDELSLLDEDDTTNKNEVVGSIEAVFSIERMENDLNKIIEFTFQLTLIVICVALFIGYYVANALTTPLAKLVHATKRVAEGDLSYSVTNDFKDEIGHLSQSFGVMVTELANDIARRERVESQLRDSKLRFQSLANKAPVGIFQFGILGECIFVNPRGLEILDATEEAILEHNWFNRIHVDDRESVECEWKEFIAQRSMFYSEFRFVHSCGEIVWVIGEAYPELCDSGKASGYIGTITDVTPLKLITEELKRSNAELDAFARIASHDLKEPMRKIQTFGSILEEDFSEALGDEGSAYLGRVVNAAQRMQSLIDGLLVYSRVATKAMPFTRLNLKDLTTEVLSDLEVALEQAGGTVNISDFPDISGDPLQVRQLMQNLIANSIKYSRDDRPPVININASVEQNMVKVVVSDNGIGFDMHHAERIFGVFERLHGRSEKYDGSGIGLSICKKIVERHGGSIYARGKPNEGAEFIFTLPLYKDRLNA